MDESKWARYSAIGAPFFVVVSLVGGFLPGTPPAMDVSAAKATEYFSDKADAIKWSALLTAVGSIGLIWFFGTLRRRFATAESGQPRLTVVATLGLVVTLAFTLIQMAISSAVAFDHELVGEGAKVFLTLTYTMGAMSFMGLTVAIAALTVVSMRGRVLPQWTNIVGWLSALGGLVGMLNLAFDDSACLWGGIIGFFLFCVWLLVAAWETWRDPAAAAA